MRIQPVPFGNMVPWKQLILRTVIDKESKYKSIEVIHKGELTTHKSSLTKKTKTIEGKKDELKHDVNGNMIGSSRIKSVKHVEKLPTKAMSAKMWRQHLRCSKY